MKSLERHPIVAVEYCESWHWLSLRAIERIWDSPDSSMTIPQLFQFLWTVFHDPKWGVSNNRMK
jgi:hypothetical protein